MIKYFFDEFNNKFLQSLRGVNATWQSFLSFLTRVKIASFEQQEEKLAKTGILIIAGSFLQIEPNYSGRIKMIRPAII